jgi:hypothetical protein
VSRTLLLCLCLALGPQLPARALAVNGEASLDARARTGYGGTTLRIFEARGSLQVTADRPPPLAPRWGFYADAGVREGQAVLDESYIDYRTAGTRLRLGRFFLPVGIHTRSELYYTGFVQLPFVKYWPFNGFVAFRSEQGLSLAGGSSRFGYELGLLGGDGSQAALGLDGPQDVSLRLQAYTGRLILGANGYAGTTRAFVPGGGRRRRAARLAGLDWRYSTPGWIVRGEWWTGRSGGRALDGGYLDLLYHPDALPAWTFVLRGEVVHFVRTARLGTLGAKYVAAPGWAIHLNWVEESRPFGTGGLNLQVLRTIEF